MAGMEERIALLSPEKRRMFERLRRQSPAAAAPQKVPADDSSPAVAAVRPECPPPMMGLETLDGEKANVKRFYDSVSAQLDPTPFGAFAFFLNYGFVSDGSRDYAALSLPEHDLNRNSVKLILEVIGDCPIAGRSVLDVGCGRGGTVATLHRFFRPGRVCALDLATNNIRFCTQTHRFANTEFFEGDAEQLPFENGAFDVVINVESSHLYPDVGAFYREVERVLRPGGRFLYADLHSAERWPDLRRQVRERGFVWVRERDITANVLLSCDQIARVRVDAYAGASRAGQLEEFLAAPGSQVYGELARRAWSYRTFALRKA
jgi:phthiocerol/phenolphthiocerol synthesis type-I polyketide synthase E